MPTFVFLFVLKIPTNMIHVSIQFATDKRRISIHDLNLDLRYSSHITYIVN